LQGIHAGYPTNPARPAEDTIMAKKPSVRYWASRKAYCCEIDGTQHILAKGPNDGPRGKTYLAAVARFSKLVSMEADKGTDDYLVSSLLNQYRIHLHATRQSGVPGVFDIRNNPGRKRLKTRDSQSPSQGEARPHDPMAIAEWQLVPVSAFA
jgi:hypothetical protein